MRKCLNVSLSCCELVTASVASAAKMLNPPFMITKLSLLTKYFYDLCIFCSLFLCYHHIDNLVLFYLMSFLTTSEYQLLMNNKLNL